MYAIAGVFYFVPLGRKMKDLARIMFWFATFLLAMLLIVRLTTRLLGDSVLSAIVAVIAMVMLGSFLRIPFLRIASDIPKPKKMEDQEDRD